MSISTTSRRSQYAGNGVTTVFSFPYYFPANTDIVVVTTTSEVDTVKTLNTHYTVSGAGNPAGGSITMLTAPAVGTSITIYTAIAQTQPQDYVTDTNFPAESHETALDRTVAMVQQLQHNMERAMRVPMSNGAQAEMQLAARKNNVLGFDANGNVTFYAFVGGAISPQSIAGTTNQVYVNGAIAPATGAVTLSLPQSIDTGATVQFGKMGINGAVGANNDILVTRSIPGVTAQASVHVTGGLTAGYDLHPNAFRDTTSFTPTVGADAYASYDAQATVSGSVALNHVHGYQVRTAYTGSNTLGIFAGYMTSNMGLNGTGTVTFMRSFYVSQPTISGGGTVGQFDGIYMDALSNATGLVNAIYIAGANRIFSAGGQIITSAELTPPAGATACRGGFTFNQTSQTGIAVMNSNATATGTMISFHRDGGGAQGSITQVNNTTVAYNTSSDVRLKENIRDMRDSGEIIDALRPKIFDWRWAKKKDRGDKGGRHATGTHGMIAQEVFTVFPEAVTVGTSEELDSDGMPMNPWGIDHSKFVPILIAELKDVRRRLAAAGIAA